MDRQFRHISIAGNIGAGKTTLAKKISKHYGWDLLLESVDNNPYLKDFYYDMKRWAFPLQIYFLHSRFAQLRTIQKSTQVVVQDRTIYEDAYIFARNLKVFDYLSDRDYDNYLQLFHTMMETVNPPDLMIYLRATTPKLMEHISIRGREYEKNISIKYLENLNTYYHEWLEEYKESKLLILDIDKIDFVNSPEGWGYVINEIEAAMRGLF